MTKFKIYHPKPETDPAKLREYVTTCRIAREEDGLFETYECKEKPSQLADNDIVVTKTDLYLTMNLTENLQRARIQRKKERVMELEARKWTRVKAFVEGFKHAESLEKLRMETELLQEYKRLKARIVDLRESRSTLLASNT